MGSNNKDSAIKIEANLICLPIIFNDDINTLELKYNRVLPLLLLNQYKYLMVKDIYNTINVKCNIIIKCLDLTFKSLIDVCDGGSLYKFLKRLKSALAIYDIYTIMNELNINVLLYNLVETVIYKKNGWDQPILVFKYRSDYDIDYIGCYGSIYLFHPGIMSHLQYSLS